MSKILSDFRRRSVEDFCRSRVQRPILSVLLMSGREPMLSSFAVGVNPPKHDAQPVSAHFLCFAWARTELFNNIANLACNLISSCGIAAPRISDVRIRRMWIRCNSLPEYGLPGAARAVYCFSHKKGSMVRIVTGALDLQDDGDKPKTPTAVAARFVSFAIGIREECFEYRS